MIKSRVTDLGTFCCYFVERSFGNLLIYPRHLDSIDHDIFKSRGGIYRQMDIEMGNQFNTKRLFEIYGAALVLNNDQKDIEFLTEEFGVDMYDHFIDYNQFGVVVYLDKKSYLFFNDRYLFDRGQVRKLEGFETIDLQKEYDYIYGSFFRGPNHS